MEDQVYGECKNQHLSMVKTYGELARVSLFQGKTHNAYENMYIGIASPCTTGA